MTEEENSEKVRENHVKQQENKESNNYERGRGPRDCYTRNNLRNYSSLYHEHVAFASNSQGALLFVIMTERIYNLDLFKSPNNNHSYFYFFINCSY